LVVSTNPSEKWWSSSAGMMTFPTEWKIIKVMVQTTNQDYQSHFWRSILNCELREWRIGWIPWVEPQPILVERPSLIQRGSCGSSGKIDHVWVNPIDKPVLKLVWMYFQLPRLITIWMYFHIFEITNLSLLVGRIPICGTVE
jgi:hypothetical protein